MSPRGRRLAAALALLAGLLFAGRWLSAFLADRWLAEAISPAAVLLLTRRALLGLGLDTIGVVASSLWLIAQARSIARAVAAIPARERGGNPLVRGLLQSPEARGWMILGALVLGLLIGSGLSQWTDAALLAGHGVSFDFADPALGLDAGAYVAWLPLWLRLQAWFLVLVLTALGTAGGAYLLTGAVRIGRGRLGITDQARRHLGLLLGVLALVVAAAQVLQPYELAAGLPFPVATGVVQLHRSVSMVLVGVSLAVAMLSFAWAARPVHGLLAGAWIGLSAALIGANYLLPDGAPDPADAVANRNRAVAESLAYALTPVPMAPSGRLQASLWDPATVRRIGRGDSLLVPQASRSSLAAADGTIRPVWVVAGPAGDDSLRLRAFVDDSAGMVGAPLTFDGGIAGADTAGLAFAVLPALAVRPGGPAVAVGRGGIALAGVGRRLLLAWALQTPALLTSAGPEASWYLDPGERLRHLFPAVVWGAARVWMREGRPQWVLDGYTTAESFPLARRTIWQGRPVTYVRAGLIAVVDAIGGTLDVYLRPGADPLSRAIAETSSGVVGPANELPASLRPFLGYPEEMLPLQAHLLAMSPRGAAHDSSTLLVATRSGRPLPGPVPGSFAVAIVDQSKGIVHALVTGVRQGDVDRLELVRPDSLATLEAPDVLGRRWQRFPFWQELSDSIVATGATLEPGGVRYAMLGDSLVAWQPSYAVQADGRTRLVLVGVAQGNRLGLARTLPDAWRNLRGEGGGLARIGGDAAVLDEARRWARAADSALRRGDLAGFAKAFDALRELLGDKTPK